jgi:hypothetical protein
MDADDQAVLDYAERRLRGARRERGALAAVGLGLLAAWLACLGWLLWDKSLGLGAGGSILADQGFWIGLGFGILLMLWLFVGAFGFVKMLRLDRGPELQVYELVLRQAGRPLPGSK